MLSTGDRNPNVARLAVLEEIRCGFHQWKYDVQPKFQRAYTVAKR